MLPSRDILSIAQEVDTKSRSLRLLDKEAAKIRKEREEAAYLSAREQVLSDLKEVVSYLHDMYELIPTGEKTHSAVSTVDTAYFHEEHNKGFGKKFLNRLLQSVTPPTEYKLLAKVPMNVSPYPGGGTSKAYFGITCDGIIVFRYENLHHAGPKNKNIGKSGTYTRFLNRLDASYPPTVAVDNQSSVACINNNGEEEMVRPDIINLRAIRDVFVGYVNTLEDYFVHLSGTIDEELTSKASEIVKETNAARVL